MSRKLYYLDEITKTFVEANTELTKREHFSFGFAKILLKDYLESGVSAIPTPPNYFVDTVSPSIARDAESQADELIKSLKEEKEV